MTFPIPGLHATDPDDYPRHGDECDDCDRHCRRCGLTWCAEKWGDECPDCPEAA